MFSVINIYLKFVIKIGVLQTYIKAFVLLNFICSFLNVSDGIFRAFVSVANLPVIGEARY